MLYQTIACILTISLHIYVCKYLYAFCDLYLDKSLSAKVTTKSSVPACLSSLWCLFQC